MPRQAANIYSYTAFAPREARNQFFCIIAVCLIPTHPNPAVRPEAFAPPKSSPNRIQAWSQVSGVLTCTRAVSSLVGQTYTNLRRDPSAFANALRVWLGRSAASPVACICVRAIELQVCIHEISYIERYIVCYRISTGE
jgi:hypothetical protein